MLSGLGPVAAFYGAIAVGFFTAVLGGAAPMISGPSAIVTIFTAVIIGTYADDLAEAFTIVMLAGLLQISFGALRLGRFVNWLPVSVVRGVFVGVGCYIFMSQTLWFLGAPVEPGIGLVAIIASWPQAVANLNGDALAVALITLAVFIVWPPKLHQVVPNALAALIAGTLAGALWFDAAPRISRATDRHPGAADAGALCRDSAGCHPAGPDPGVPQLHLQPADGADHRPHHRPQSQAQPRARRLGSREYRRRPDRRASRRRVGPVLPARRPIGRAHRAVTGVVCAAVLLAVLFGLGTTLTWIPHAAFAGIVIKVGWDMMDIRFLRRIPRLSADIGIVTLLTAVLSIFVDVISAIAVGFFIAGMANALRSERQELNQTVSTPLLDMVLFPEGEVPPDADPFRARVGLLSLRGSYSIASAREIVRVISPDLADHEVVIFDFSETAGMDDSAAMALEELINGSVLGQDKGCIVAGLSGDLEKSLTSLGIFDRVPQDAFAADLDGAKRAAARLLQR